MHYLAPLPIILGAFGAIVGFLWLVFAGSEEDGGPDTNSILMFDRLYLIFRTLKQLSNNPVSILPALAILLVSAGLIWLGIVMI